MMNLRLFSACALVALAAACAHSGPQHATADFISTNGRVVGRADLTQTREGVLIALKDVNLPRGKRAIHIHTTGRCDKPSFESAGPHYNPHDKKHGMENHEGPHAGDLPNIIVPDSGRLTQDILAPGITLAELLDADGSAIIVHAKRDDNKTDPAGNAGKRIACAVIKPVASK